jgi:hypothetical protein
MFDRRHLSGELVIVVIQTKDAQDVASETTFVCDRGIMTWCSSIFAAEIERSSSHEAAVAAATAAAAVAPTMKKKEPPLPRITLSRIPSPELFALFHSFVHTGSFFRPQTPPPSTASPVQKQKAKEEESEDEELLLPYDHLLPLWIFADHHDIPLLQNHLIGLLLERILLFPPRNDHDDNDNDDYTLPTLASIENVFEQSFPGTSLLKRFLCAVARESWRSLRPFYGSLSYSSSASSSSSSSAFNNDDEDDDDERGNNSEIHHCSVMEELDELLQGREERVSPSSSFDQPAWKTSAEYIANVFRAVERLVSHCPGNRGDGYDGYDDDGGGGGDGRVVRPITLATLLGEDFVRRVKGCEWHVHEEGVTCF